jgi:hypothetical protein
MTRIKFENSPSTNTPINAENLNKLNNVIVSSKEPTTGEEVWIDNVNKKIHTKTDNGYEEFYNGKPNDTGWIKLSNIIKYRKIGNVVTVAGDSRGTQALTKENYTTVGTLPDGFKPSVAIEFPWARIGEGDVGVTIIGTDGSIKLFSTSGTSYWGFTTTYLVD